MPGPTDLTLTFAKLKQSSKLGFESAHPDLRKAAPEVQHHPHRESINIAAAQIAILSNSLVPENFDIVVQQIHYICETFDYIVFSKYFSRLVLTCSSVVPGNTVVNPTIDRLIEFELKSAIEKPDYSTQFAYSIIRVNRELSKNISLLKFFNHFHLSDFEKVYLSLLIASNLDQNPGVGEEISEIVKEIIDTSIIGFLDRLRNIIKDKPSNYRLLELITVLALESRVLSLLHKFIILNYAIDYIGSDEIKTTIKKGISKFYKDLSKMKFLDILRELPADSISPERLLNDLLSIQTQGDLEDALSVLFAEILQPGSQHLSVDGNLTALTPLSVPEATAKGSQFGSIMRKLSVQPNWSTVFKRVEEKLPEGLKFSQASISEVLSALDDSTIDAFLEYEWPLSIKISLFISLRQLDPSSGGFDLLRTNYLKPLTSNIAFTNIKNSVLYFAKVINLELSCISESSAIEDAEYKRLLHQKFEEDIRNVPELVALGCAQYHPPSATVDDLLENLIVHLLDPESTYYDLILKNIRRDEQLLGIVEKLAQIKPTVNNKIISYLSESGLLEKSLKTLDFKVGLKLAVSAVKTGWNNFDLYLSEHKKLPEFADTLLSFLREESSTTDDPSKSENNKTTSLKAIYVILDTVSKQDLNESEFQDLKKIQSQTLQAFPRLINFGFGHDEAILANGDANTFPFDVEQQMKVFYQRMYNHEIEIKDVISMLSSLRDSDQPRDQDVFACMIHSLLDEYRFFPEYPLNALAITSVLFGSMIFFQLIRGTALTIALRYILDSGNQPPDSNMFKFAVQALYAFRQRLGEFPNYCSALLNIESLKSQSQIYQIVLDAVNNRDAPESSLDDSSTVPEAPQHYQHATSKQQIFKSIAPTNSLPNPVNQEQPRQDIAQRILFLVNNLSEDTLADKSSEIKNILTPSIYSWFSHYLVVQRVKSEPNNHDLYSVLIRQISNMQLVDHIVSVTLLEVNDLLNDSDETPTERSYLKNLGSWLGRITLAQDKPIKYRNLSVKGLLVESHNLSKLALVVPFVCKMVDQTKYSEVFRLPNPWTLGILKVLSELYVHFNLKLNLRFEIEVLCNSLKINLEDVEPSSVIRNYNENDFRITQSLSADFANLNITKPTAMMPAQQAISLSSSGDPHHQHEQQSLGRESIGILPQQSLLQNSQTPQVFASNAQQAIQQPLHQQAARIQAHITEAMFQNLVGTTVFVTHLDLKRMFIMALTKSVREILPPAVERAVSISVTTTRSLILKDFATEVDEIKLRSAAYTVVRRLSEGLALATARDPLKENIQSTMHSFAPQLVNASNSPFEELPQAINDNIDLACSVVQKATMEKAVQEIEEILVAPVAVRRLHKERRPDQPFLSQYFSRYSITLPDPLGLKPTGVTQQQYQVYENFGRQTIASQSPASAPLQISSQVPSEGPIFSSSSNTAQQRSVQQPQTLVSSLQQQQPQQQVTADQTFTYVQTLVESLLRSISESQALHLVDLAQESPIKVILGQLFTIAARNLNREPLLLKIAQFIVNALFTTSESELAVDVFVFLLEKLCTISASTRKDVVWWLVHATDERKYNSKVILALLKANIISAANLDEQLSKSITPDNPTIAKFAIQLISESVLIPNAIAYRTDFVLTIDVLRTLENDPGVKEFIELIEHSDASFIVQSEEISEADRFGYVFTEWVRLLQHESKNEKLQIIFIHQMVQTGILGKADNIALFLKNSTEISVAFFNGSDPSADVFLVADALAKLIVKLMLLQNEQDISRANYFKLILSVVSLVFANDHENLREKFNERPYFRIFSTLLSEWVSIDLEKYSSNESEKAALEEFNTQFYMILADFFNAYQPLAFPGFAFAWITLISHRLFLPNILELKNTKAQAKFVLLLLDLLRFESKYVKQKEIPEVISVIYKGNLRIFLLLLHDYPDVLVQNHYQLCCEIPMSFVQLKNVVLSAFPKNISIPDPFTQGLKVDRLPEISETPTIAYNPAYDLKGLKKPIDGFLRIPSGMLLKTILNGLKQSPTEEAGIGYSRTNFNTKMINSVVLYVGIQAVNERQASGQIFNPKSSQFLLLAGLMQEGSIEFQYHLIEAICNHLRYPNSHTYWFSYIILHFFGSQSLWNGKKEQSQQIITRVLLERIICNRPHPWGLLITFTELIKNSDLQFFDLSFTKCAPEIEKMFGALLRHIGLGSTNKFSNSSAVS